MTTITVTPRLREFITKCFKVDSRKLQVLLKKCLKDKEWFVIENRLDNTTLYNENIKIKTQLHAPSHEYNCKYCDERPEAGDPEDDEVCNNYDFETYADCDCQRDTHSISIEIKYKKCLLHKFWCKSDNISNLSNFINEIPSTVQVCLCGKLADVNDDCIDKCDMCFIHSYIRTEVEGGDCVICLNNDSHCWNGLPCSHNFHTHCLWQLSDKKCPLCREPYNDEKRNVYNV